MITVGRIGRAHGVRGWVRVHSFCDPAKNLLSYKPWHVLVDDKWTLLPLKHATLASKCLLAQLEDCVTRDQAMMWTDRCIGISQEQLPQLADQEFYWQQLVGLRVHTLQGVDLGVVEQLLETGANDVLVVQNGRQRLVPYAKDVVQHVDLKQGLMVVDWDPEF